MTRNNPFTQYRMSGQSIEVVDLTSDVRTATPQRPVKTETIDKLAEATKRLAVTDDEDGSVPVFGLVGDFDEEAEDDVHEIRELTPGEAADLFPRASVAPTYVASVMTQAGSVKVNMSVQLSDGDFLIIKHLSNKNVRGILLCRTRWMKGTLPKKSNELCAILKTRVDAQDPAVDGCWVVRPLSDIVAIRHIILTNQPFPNLRLNLDQQNELYLGSFFEQGPLVCRWKSVEFCDAGNKVVVQSITKLNQEESTDGTGIPQSVLRNEWRGLAVKAEEPQDEYSFRRSSGTGRDNKRAKVDVDLTDEYTSDDTIYEEIIVAQQIRRVHGNSVYTSKTITTKTEHVRPRFSASSHMNFTYGDICTGAGGTARGAHQAGLTLKFFLDHWDDACKTLDENWPDVDILHMDIFTFLTTTKHFDLRVDILHISFPCQPHSPAHTVDGKNDDANIAAAYSVIEILQKCRPRIVTFEQTSGIVTHNGGYHFRALLHQLTVMNYSVRSGIVHCDEYGNSQPRKRLIIIAACPGETLPPFPKVTHGTGGNLLPRVTIRDRLRLLRNKPIERHMQEYTSKTGRPYNDRQPLAQCITTDGGKSNLHPKGDRTFSLQELACLAGFPLEHSFYPKVKGVTSIRRQIGNAVPPCVAKALFTQITETMRETDREIAAWESQTIEVD
ncbi:hypothetical protein LTR09_002124 [Extremus antarcticus]|uniref:DNA (cytosine-5-)-methyltransferase n=1 Tax=Extremus antarcticus TaxID=702011 RepID=A0AAJ0GGG7_9PEZI|nr:hypothetical protein LTR09_002124 [Extremus antarcticus]